LTTHEDEITRVRNKILQSVERQLTRTKTNIEHIRATLLELDPAVRIPLLKAVRDSVDGELRAMTYRAVESGDEAMRAFVLEHKDIRCQLSWPVSDNYLVRLVVAVL